jgi:hypothetical protein
VTNEQTAHIALPKLYGAPAYARPPVLTVVTADRPFDPDSLPLEIEQTEEERELTVELAATSSFGAAISDALAASRDGSELRGRPFQLTAIKRRIRRDGKITRR